MAFGCFSCVPLSGGKSSNREDDTDQVESPYMVVNAPVFKISQLHVATDNFNNQNFLGQGRLGCVYKGILENGQEVAVKKLRTNTRQGRAAFRAEVKMLSCVEHSNIVKLIGHHDEGNIVLIVYEFMPLRSLDLYLYGHESNKEPLDWKTRMKIAEGVAKALLFLHDKNDPPVIYVDLKSSGILLDEKFNPKLSDFSFAKFGPTWDCREAPQKLIETIGYAPPEYFMTGKITLRHVIYSFGVLLLELIAGRKAIQENLPFSEQSIDAWARPLLVSKKFTEIADPVLGGRYPEDELAQALTVAEMCIQQRDTKRPPIAQIVTVLSNILSEAEGEAWDRKEAS